MRLSVPSVNINNNDHYLYIHILTFNSVLSYILYSLCNYQLIGLIITSEFINKL